MLDARRHGERFRLYQTLELPRTDATHEEVKRAYKKLSLRHHPDRNPGDDGATGRFQAVVSAYDVLGSAEKRQIYDRYGEQGLRVFESYLAFAAAGRLQHDEASLEVRSATVFGHHLLRM